MNRKKFKNTRVLCSLSAMAGIGLLTVSAMGDDCYHIVDLGVLGFTPSTADIFGINNANQAVFTTVVAGKKHAMLYLPVGAYGLAAGVHDLDVLAGAAITGDESAAHDINEAGIVVGWAEIGTEQHAFVWRLDTVPFEFVDLGTFLAGNSSTAYAINDDTPFPIVVGDGLLLFDCACQDEPPPFDDDVRRAFALELRNPPDDLDQAALLDQDPGLSCQPATWARDVKSPAGLTVAGFSTAGTVDCFVPETCGVGNAATAWIDPTPGNNDGDALALLPPVGPFDSGGTQAWGVSDTGALVGYAYTHSVAPCKQHAVYWDTDIVVEPLDLGVVGDLVAGDQTVALRINNNASPDTLQVVGYQLASPDLAFLWECDSGCDVLASWSATELDGIIQHCSDFWSIRQAHDVNDDGWIVGWADANDGGPAEYHAVLLFPEADCEVCCFADLDCSGSVGAADLLAILAAWGPCPAPPAVCDADLNCDGTVGAEDLLNLLAVWAECQTSAPSEIPRTVQNCFDKFFPDEMAALIACIEAIE